MKINIPENCIIINGVLYELVEQDNGDCVGCAFKKESSRGCNYEAPCVNIFSTYNAIFKRVSPLIND